ncbi:hypothetical protein GWK47_036181 [Chionoecetes opilio]|uniref:Uncharacterized protein n=1 Tax=Chionoecetes opilio TaxID=41210 RepID=A0A8J4YEG4_CHIOP|nr:hypothetical protein GWK47_036181 [Chionoecetes opilio]
MGMLTRVFFSGICQIFTPWHSSEICVVLHLFTRTTDCRLDPEASGQRGGPSMLGCDGFYSQTVVVDRSPEENITGSRLPSKGQVLRKFYFHHGLEKKNKGGGCEGDRGGSPRDLEEAGLPTSTLRYNKAKLLKLVEAYEGLQKHKKRASETARMKEDIFQGDRDDLFDVAHRDALEKTTNEEDRAFLISQSEDRSTSSMTGLDTVSARLQEKKRKREEAEVKRKQAAEMEKKIASSSVPSSQVASSSSFLSRENG